MHYQNKKKTRAHEKTAFIRSNSATTHTKIKLRGGSQQPKRIKNYILLSAAIVQPQMSGVKSGDFTITIIEIKDFRNVIGH